MLQPPRRIRSFIDATGGQLLGDCASSERNELITSIVSLDYGDIAGSMGSDVNPFHHYNGSDQEDEDIPPVLWEGVEKLELDANDIRDYWLGTGKIYVFKLPDLQLFL
jgi:hypothetical protein